MSVPSFGIRVRAWREHLGRKQQDVAASANIKPARLCRIEKGHRAARIDEAERLAVALGISVAQLGDLPTAAAPEGAKVDASEAA